MHWKKYQKQIVTDIKKENEKGISVAGDGRHDSMGHSAKYCAYTILCCTTSNIIHFSLVQVWLEVHVGELPCQNNCVMQLSSLNTDIVVCPNKST